MYVALIPQGKYLVRKSLIYKKPIMQIFNRQRQRCPNEDKFLLHSETQIAYTMSLIGMWTSAIMKQYRKLT